MTIASRARRRASIVAGLVVIGAVATVGTADATGTPAPTCATFGSDWTFPTGGAPGDYTLSGQFKATIASNGTSINWTSERPIDGVIVSDATGGKTYAYVPPPTGALSGAGLTGPTGGSVTGVTFCYTKRVVVTKTATTTYKRTYGWTIEKSANPTTLNLLAGQSADSTFVVRVQRDSRTGTDSDFAVSGKITVSNPWTRDAVLTSIADTMTGGLTGAVTCPVTFPHTLSGGSSVECTYSAALPDKAARTNTATANVSNANLSDGLPPVRGGSGSASVTFGSPTTEVNASVNVDDTNGMSWRFDGDLSSQTYKKTFTCGSSQVYRNTATIRETKQSASATVTVNCTPPPPPPPPPTKGCTLTQGYWKNHADATRKKFDATWLMVPPFPRPTSPSGPSAIFFLTLRTWPQVFDTPPRGNPYYILAHQYMAARLNVLAGASAPTAVSQAITAATFLFEEFGPSSQVLLNPDVRRNMLSWATTLEQFNSGRIGPGKCKD